MSGMAGSSYQPDSVTRSRTSTGAPQVGQLIRLGASVLIRHQRQVYVPDMPLVVRVVVDVHRLDADAPRPRHPGQVHPGPAEQAAGEALRLDLHGDGRVLVEERAGLE